MLAISLHYLRGVIYIYYNVVNVNIRFDFASLFLYLVIFYIVIPVYASHTPAQCLQQMYFPDLWHPTYVRGAAENLARKYLQVNTNESRMRMA